MIFPGSPGSRQGCPRIVHRESALLLVSVQASEKNRKTESVFGIGCFSRSLKLAGEPSAVWNRNARLDRRIDVQLLKG